MFAYTLPMLPSHFRKSFASLDLEGGNRRSRSLRRSILRMNLHNSHLIQAMFPSMLTHICVPADFPPTLSIFYEEKSFKILASNFFLLASSTAGFSLAGKTCYHSVLRSQPEVICRGWSQSCEANSFFLTYFSRIDVPSSAPWSFKLSSKQQSMNKTMSLLPYFSLFFAKTINLQNPPPSTGSQGWM